MQFELPMKDADRAMLRSVRARAALRSYANEVGLKMLASLWGCDEGTVAAKLGERNRNYVKTHEWMAVFDADTSGAVFTAWCEQAGYERPEKKQPPASDGDRVLAAAEDLFGPEILELLKRKAGV